ncbi:unnamed protein product, partial [Rotaria magnacalcarata]
VAIYGRLRPFTIVSGRRNVQPGKDLFFTPLDNGFLIATVELVFSAIAGFFECMM